MKGQRERNEKNDPAVCFPIPGVDGKIRDAPSPEIPASWLIVFNDEILTVTIMIEDESMRKKESIKIGK